MLLSANERAYFCKSIAIEMGGVSRYFSKISGSGVDVTLLNFGVSELPWTPSWLFFLRELSWGVIEGLRNKENQTSCYAAPIGAFFCPEIRAFTEFWGEISSTVSKALSDRKVLFKHKNGGS